MLGYLLAESDRNYFKAAAFNTEEMGGVLSVMPAFAQVPAACVLHSVDIDDIGNLESWTSALEQLFESKKASLVRFYLESDTWRGDLESLGYRRTVEVGLGLKLETAEFAGGDELHLLESSAESFLQHELLVAGGDLPGPDGYPMGDGAYAAIQHKKIMAGYMKPYFAVSNNEFLGSVKMAPQGNFCRLKNVMVNPRHRRRRVATRMVESAIMKSVRQGYSGIGVYVFEKSKAFNVYRTLGMEEVGRQYEWTKPIV